MRKITINEDKEHFNKGIFHSSETETLSSDMTKCLADAAENTNQTPSHHDRQPPSLQVGLGHLFYFILFIYFDFDVFFLHLAHVLVLRKPSFKVPEDFKLKQ